MEGEKERVRRRGREGGVKGLGQGLGQGVDNIDKRTLLLCLIFDIWRYRTGQSILKQREFYLFDAC
jgi:hypothetical protein